MHFHKVFLPPQFKILIIKKNTNKKKHLENCKITVTFGAMT